MCSKFVVIFVIVFSIIWESENLAIKECGVCPYIYFPVCASDGNFYDNKCLMDVEACQSGKKLHKMEDSYCTQKLPTDCPKGCPFIYKPVCGSDGLTYSNICVMKSDACELGKEITVTKEGACEDDRSMSVV